MVLNASLFWPNVLKSRKINGDHNSQNSGSCSNQTNKQRQLTNFVYHRVNRRVSNQKSNAAHFQVKWFTIHPALQLILLSSKQTNVKTSFDPKRLWHHASLYMWNEMKLVALSRLCSVILSHGATANVNSNHPASVERVFQWNWWLESFMCVNFRCFKLPTPKGLETSGCILFCRLAQSMLTTHATHTDGVKSKLCETWFNVSMIRRIRQRYWNEGVVD